MGTIALTRRRLPDWHLWSVPLTVAIAISLTLIGTGALGVALAVAARLSGHTARLTSPGGMIGSTFLMDLAMVGAALISARIAEGRLRLAGFGFVPVALSGSRVAARAKAVGLVIATWVVFLAFTAVWNAIVGKPGKQKIISEFGADQSDLLWLLTLVMIGFVAPFAEEILFRGSFLTALWRRIPLVPSALITGVMFGALHLGGSPLKMLVPLSFLGFLLCVLRAMSGSLVPCIAVHALNNSIAFGVGQDVAPGWGVLIVVVSVTAAVGTATAIVRRTYNGFDDAEADDREVPPSPDAPGAALSASDGLPG